MKLRAFKIYYLTFLSIIWSLFKWIEHLPSIQHIIFKRKILADFGYLNIKPKLRMFQCSSGTYIIIIKYLNKGQVKLQILIGSQNLSIKFHRPDIKLFFYRFPTLLKLLLINKQRFDQIKERQYDFDIDFFLWHAICLIRNLQVKLISLKTRLVDINMESIAFVFLQLF